MHALPQSALSSPVPAATNTGDTQLAQSATGGLRRAAGHNSPLQGEQDLTGVLTQAGIDIPRGEKVLVSGHAIQFINAWAVACGHDRHAWLNAGTDAFRGGVALIHSGLLPRKDEKSGSSKSWAQWLVKVGKECPDEPGRLSLDERFGMLKQVGIDLEPALVDAIADAIKNSADKDQCDECQTTADKMQALLRAGACPKAKYRGNNALHAAAMDSRCTIETLRELIRADVSLWQENENGKTPFDLIPRELFDGLMSGTAGQPDQTFQQYVLGCLHLKNNPAHAIRLLLAAAGNSCARAQALLGSIHLTGQGVGQDYELAEKWLKQAAGQGLATAEFGLGVLYETRSGEAPDQHQAAQWFEAAANRGHALAQYRLGVMYLTGRGVERDDRKARAWLVKAAEQGCAHAQHDLGYLYKIGHVVERDDRKAEALFGKAAEQGHAQARVNLGVLHFDKARSQFHLAASQGHGLAQHHLYALHSIGFVLPEVAPPAWLHALSGPADFNRRLPASPTRPQAGPAMQQTDQARNHSVR